MQKKQSQHLGSNEVNLQKNIMTVDLEDYFCDLDFSEWQNYESRVINNTKKILKFNS